MAKPNRLTFKFAIAGLIGIALIAIALVVIHREIASTSIIEQEGRSNSETARLLLSSLWPRHGAFLLRAGTIPTEQLKQSEALGRLRGEVLDAIRGSRVVRLTIYDPKGVVLFSTTTSLIGENHFYRAALRQARSGKLASGLAAPGEFAGDTTGEPDKTLVITHVPLAGVRGELKQWVMRVDSNVAPLLSGIAHGGERFVAVVVLLLLLLYLSLVIFVRRAELLIARHSREQEQLQQERLSYLERHDELTGLFNRSGIMHILQTAHKRHLGLDSSLGVMLVKLSNFHELNSLLGHRLGDRLLRLAANRIKVSAPGGDSAGRFDGDEFVIVLENLIAEDEVQYTVSRLHNMFAEPIELDGRCYTISLAIGVCTSAYGEYSTEQLLMNAGSALGVAKYASAKPYVMFDERLEQERQQRFERAQELVRAIEEREFVLHYQPLVDALTGKVVGMEALLRWQHPERGLLMPGEFVEMLEETGGIIALGPWLLQQACSQCKAWQEESGRELRVAVNISVRQLRADGFVQSVGDALRQSGLHPKHLELELTESMLVADKHEVRELLRVLKRIGVQLTLDDFGTGYSSLSYLMHFPLDYLKIDKSFVRDITHNREHAILTRTIIAMARNLNLGIVAEGIESLEQRDFLQAMGCDKLQGYYYSRAVNAADFLDVVRTVEEMTHGVNNRHHGAQER